MAGYAGLVSTHLYPCYGCICPEAPVPLPAMIEFYSHAGVAHQAIDRHSGMSTRWPPREIDVVTCHTCTVQCPSPEGGANSVEGDVSPTACDSMMIWRC